MPPRTPLAILLALAGLPACNDPSPPSPVAPVAPAASAPPAPAPPASASASASTPSAPPSLAPPCHLSINTQPPSKAFVDDRAVGDTPVLRVPAPAGAHTIRFEGAGLSRTVSVTCTPGESRIVAVDLRTGALQPTGPRDAGADPFLRPL